MKYYEGIVKFILHQIGEPIESEELKDTIIFKKFGEEIAILSPEASLSIDKNLYDSLMNNFILDKKELDDIFKKIIYNLTGIKLISVKPYFV
jgi:hypothetical protein